MEIFYLQKKRDNYQIVVSLSEPFGTKLEPFTRRFEAIESTSGKHKSLSNILRKSID